MRTAAPGREHAKIAFIGSHGIRKSYAVAALASELGPACLSYETVREWVRYNPLGLNEGATPEAQLWVLMTQIKEELEHARRADVMITDRSVIDNWAYFLRAAGGDDLFGVEPLIRSWSASYDILVRLLPDVPLIADGVRSVNDAFRDEVEVILDEILPDYTYPGQVMTIAASHLTCSFDWSFIVERLAGVLGREIPASYMEWRGDTPWLGPR